jgi:hypothetical protein
MSERLEDPQYLPIRKINISTVALKGNTTSWQTTLPCGVRRFAKSWYEKLSEIGELKR